MNSPTPSQRALIILVAVLALVAVLLCGLIWKLYLFPLTPTPAPAAMAIPTMAATPPSPGPSGLPELGEAALFGNLAPGMYVAYDQTRFEGNGLDYARGSHLFIPWRRIEDGPRGYYDWTAIDEPLARLAPGKKAILRLILRCADVPVAEGRRDACAPNWAIEHDPILVSGLPCNAPTKRLNYLNPVVQQGLVDLIHAMGARYGDDPRIAAVEIGFGYGGETAPWPYTRTVCDRNQQESAYRSRPEYADPGKAWAEYEKRIIQAYADAFQGQKALTALINGAYAERYRGDIVRFAVEHGVGFALSSLRSDFNANRGSAENRCYWGFITELGFDNDSERANAAYLTEWAPLIVNKGRVPIGFEFNNRYDNTGRIPPEGEAFTRWSMLNALDKGADYILAFNDGKGFLGNIRYPDVWRFFERYAGRDAISTPDVWIAFRSPWKEGAWCPDIYDYSWHLTSELETLPYVSAVDQKKVALIDSATGVFDIGPPSDWRSYYARATADIWPAFNLDIDDAFAANIPGDVDVVVTYFDHVHGGKWALYYDSAAGEKLAGVVTLTGSNAWKTHTFRLEDARFANGLRPLSPASRTSGFDLRLDRVDPVDDIFSMVRVIPAPVTPTPPAPTFTPPTATPTPPIQERTLRLQQGRDG
ncbi:MAG TPA: hypothetical protein EYP25_06165, partial [Anaerolineae bacterium]|nr:hypothetical protein [Anaerolineae bacterium]